MKAHKQIIELLTVGDSITEIGLFSKSTETSSKTTRSKNVSRAGECTRMELKISRSQCEFLSAGCERATHCVDSRHSHVLYASGSNVVIVDNSTVR